MYDMGRSYLTTGRMNSEWPLEIIGVDFNISCRSVGLDRKGSAVG